MSDNPNLPDPVEHKFMGNVKMGFHKHIKSGKMKVVLTPEPSDRQDQESMTMMALYTAAIRESINHINKSMESIGFFKGLNEQIQKGP